MAGPSTSTVTVALKHPHGLILHLYTMVEKDEPMYGGGYKTVKEAVRRVDIDPVRLYGYAAPFGQPAPLTEDGDPVLLMGGYALTSNVPADFWTEWLIENENSDLVKKNLIFAASRQSDARDQAKEQRAVKSGFEPLDVDSGKDPRVNRKIQKMSTKEAA